MFWTIAGVIAFSATLAAAKEARVQRAEERRKAEQRRAHWDFMIANNMTFLAGTGDPKVEQAMIRYGVRPWP